MGVITNVGRDVKSTAASIRAGIVKIVDVGGGLETYDEEDLSIPLKGCAIKGFSDGFLQTGLWVRFSLTCFHQLIQYGSLPKTSDHNFWSDVGFYWILPDMNSDRFMSPASAFDNIVNYELTDVLVNHLGIPTPKTTGYSIIGHAGIGEAFQTVTQWINTGQANRAVVIAVDSCLDLLALTHYCSLGRIRTPQINTGFFPGEASAVMLLENGSRTDAKIESCIYKIGTESPVSPSLPDDFNSLTAQFGKRLAKAMRDALRPLSEASKNFQGDIYVDLNGEEWRSKAWGIAVNNTIDIINFDHCNIIIPAISVGEVGAASGGINVCLATRAFVKKYSCSAVSLVCSLSENGASSAILLKA